MFATSSTTRGDAIPQESGISKQISREGNLTISDDMAKIVVERVVHEMANWSTQLMKMFYKEAHYLKEMGQNGEVVYIDLKQDQIDDGISVTVKSSSVDKAQRRNDALELAAAKSTDPLTLFEDMDVPNPKLKATRLIAWLTGEQDGYARYSELIGIDVTSPEDGGEGDVMADIKKIINGETVEPTKVDEKYLAALGQFIQGPEFQSIPPDAQQRIAEYIQSLKQQADSLQVPPQEQGTNSNPQDTLTPTPAPATMEAQ